MFGPQRWRTDLIPFGPYEELRSEYFSAQTRQSVNKRSIIVWQPHETQSLQTELASKRWLVRIQENTARGTTNQILELAKRDTVFQMVI